ncbi:MAG: NAD(P)/FAD-dependent oxidoreductase [Flavobacteriales bacterium]
MNFSYWEKQFISSSADLIIIGSGITGLSAAYHAASKHPKWKIIVLDKFVYSNAASTRNAGFACFGSAGELTADLRNGLSYKEVFSTLEKRLKGLTLLRDTLGDSALDYESCGGTEIFTSNQENEYHGILNQLDELNYQLNEFTNSADTFQVSSPPSALVGFKYAIKNELEGKLNPGSLMKAWAKKCQDLGVEIYGGMSAQLLEDYSGVSIKNHVIKSKQIAVCTNGLSESLRLDLKLSPARNLVVLTEPIPKLELPSTYHHLQGYMYFRKIHDRLLLGGGRHEFLAEEETSKFEVNSDLRLRLERYLKEHFGILPEQIEMEWTGIMGVGNSKKPLVNRLNEHVVYGVKLGGMGVAIGSLVGKEVADLL